MQGETLLLATTKVKPSPNLTDYEQMGQIALSYNLFVILITLKACLLQCKFVFFSCQICGEKNSTFPHLGQIYKSNDSLFTNASRRFPNIPNLVPS